MEFFNCVAGMSRGHRIDRLRDVESGVMMIRNARRANF